MKYNDFKRLFKKIFFLDKYLIFTLDIICILAMTYFRLNNSFIIYLIYCLSFYSLLVTTIFVSFKISSIKKRILKIPIIIKYRNDIQFKIKIRLSLSLCLNTLYAIFKFFMGYILLSTWEVHIGIYYLIIGILRFILLHHVNYNELGVYKIKEYKKVKQCGYLLILLNLILSGLVFLMVYRNHFYTYPAYTIFIVALYTFYNFINGCAAFIRYRKYDSPIINAANIICLILALVSLLTLQTAMLVQFGNESFQTNQLINGLTGSIVCSIISIISLYLVIKSKRKIKELS